MGEVSTREVNVLERADTILGNLGLTCDNLQGKSILDVGSGSSALAHASRLRGLNAKVYSLDLNFQKSWKKLPYGVRSMTVQADAEALPYGDDSFDYVVTHGSVFATEAIDAVRVLRPGGELRIYPVGGHLLEYWYVSYYLDVVKHLDRSRISNMMESFDTQIREADGWIPNEYITLRKEALDSLSTDQKLDVLDLLVQRYSEVTGIPFEFDIKDANAREPNGVLIYKK